MKYLPCLLFPALLYACAGGPQDGRNGERVLVPGKEAEINARLRAKAQADLPRDMLDLDKAIDKYIQARNALPNDRAMRLVTKLDGLIRGMAHKHFDILRARAMNAKYPGNRTVALFALGFADHGDEVRMARAKLRDKLFARGIPENKVPPPLPDRSDFIDQALEPMLAALHDGDAKIRSHALLGIGQLQSPRTSLNLVTQLLEDDKQPQDVLRNAAWTLLQLQDTLPPKQRLPIRAAYLRLLSRPLGEVAPEVASQVLWALAQFRVAADAPTVQPYCKHPAPLIRINAALALGLMKNEAAVPDLLSLIRPAETNPNVRLTARKALVAMAGGRDRQYDVAGWKALFQRK